MPHPSPLTDLERAIGINFKKKDFLRQALIHRSSVRESQAYGNNERLEFLGDAVLELATTEYLYQLSDKPEGELTNWRSALVQGEHLAEIAKDLELGQYLSMSRGEEASGGRTKVSTLANAFEAVIGAVYLDKGYDVAKKFCEDFVLHDLDRLLAAGKHRDEKSVFQEMVQEKTGVTPHYEVVVEEGPDHDKEFTMAVYIGEERVAEGKGNSKQRAEQAAAKAALTVKGWK
ncbi:MAG: ribonuclease III [Candidatus Peribacteraceae bacterium]|nr:ribonuclease III [Candidatus Peribacteraceae bacterium]